MENGRKRTARKGRGGVDGERKERSHIYSLEINHRSAIFFVSLLDLYPMMSVAEETAKKAWI